MTATTCTCIGRLTPTDHGITWTVDVIDEDCPTVWHRGGVA